MSIVTARLRMFALATTVAGSLAGLGAVLFPTFVNACAPIGTPTCPALTPPVAGQNGLPLILAIDAGGLVVLGVLILLAVLYLRQRRSRIGRENNADK